MGSADNGNKICVPEKILHRFVFLKGHFIFGDEIDIGKKPEGDHFTLYLLNVAHASLYVYSMLTSPALQTMSAVQPAM